ncbi:citrate lyase [Steroidobacter denitrificans]|uniref:Citrate lyase n=1 Tax=Steroidobacter denitrificans TaxID=465721 RepID=A0A127FBV0_STEDE|nr:citrate lyase [Steroidobacter denitrificans]
MQLRSLLFVPGDRPDRMRKALTCGADALILDLEDSVVLEAKPAARRAVHAFLKDVEGSTTCLFVRVNPLDSGLVDEDLEALCDARPDGIMLPKAEGGASVAALDARLTSLGWTDGMILPITAETPSAIFSLGSYRGSSTRLCGLTWGAEDLPASIGAISARQEDGRYSAPYELARSLTLFAAHAAGVAAIETVYPAFRDPEGLAAYAQRGRRDGFTGMMAIHPSQIEIINAAFTPTDAQIAAARAVVELFENNPGAGALSIEGKMIDIPHLKAARRVLAMKTKDGS